MGYDDDGESYHLSTEIELPQPAVLFGWSCDAVDLEASLWVSHGHYGGPNNPSNQGDNISVQSFTARLLLDGDEVAEIEVYGEKQKELAEFLHQRAGFDLHRWLRDYG